MSNTRRRGKRWILDPPSLLAYEHCQHLQLQQPVSTQHVEQFEQQQHATPKHHPPRATGRQHSQHQMGTRWRKGRWEHFSSTVVVSLLLGETAVGTGSRTRKEREKGSTCKPALPLQQAKKGEVRDAHSRRERQSKANSPDNHSTPPTCFDIRRWSSSQPSRNMNSTTPTLATT